MAYIINPTLPTLTNFGKISPDMSAYATFFTVWQSSDSDYHCITQFSLPSLQKTYVNHINMTDQTAHIYAVDSVTNIGRAICFDYTNNTLYFASVYGGPGWFYKYDLTAETGPEEIYYDLGAPGYTMIVGSDGIIWMNIQDTKKLISYNPATETIVDTLYGDTDADYIQNFAADATYVYCANRSGSSYWLTRVTISNGTLSHLGKGTATVASVFVGPDDSYYCRLVISGSNHFYALPSMEEVGGDPGSHAQPDPRYNCVTDGLTGTIWETVYNYRFDFDMVIPYQGTQEYSRIRYKTPKTAPDENYITVDIAYTGPWGSSVADYSQLGMGNGNIIVVDLNNHNTTGYNYKTSALTAYRSYWLNTYGMLNAGSGIVYLFDYSNIVYKWDTNSAWTLTAGADVPYEFADSPKPNPFQIYYSSFPGNYVFDGDYDSNGVIWTIAVNGVGDDYGELMWYDPSDGTTGYIADFHAVTNPTPGPGITLNKIVATNGRTRLCVTAGDTIYLINTENKTWIDTYTTNTDLIICPIEVADDILLMVQASVSDNTGNVSRITKMRVSTGEILLDDTIGVAGWIFGGQSGNSISRFRWKFTKGADNQGYIFVGNNLYRVDPSDCSFNLVTNTTWSWLGINTPDLLLYGNTDDKVYQDFWLYVADYSRGTYESLPGTDADLTTAYTAADLEDVATDDGVRVAQSVNVGGYAIHEFKNDAGSYNSVTLHWDGQTSVAPSDSIVKLQIYNRNTPGWEDVPGASNNTANANEDFTLTGTVDITSGYKDDNNMISCRVWQQAV